MSMYLQQLIQIAQVELPALQHDLANASTLFTLQAATQRMHNVLSYLTHHAIHECLNAGGGAPRLPVAAPQVPVQVPAVTAPPTAYFPHLAQPVPTPHIPGVTAPQTIHGSQVTEVVMTAQGTKIIPAGGALPVAVVPPGSHADATIGQAAHQQSPQFRQPMDGNVMVPQGGVMTPETLAALSAARNITNDPSPTP